MSTSTPTGWTGKSLAAAAVLLLLAGLGLFSLRQEQGVRVEDMRELPLEYVILSPQEPDSTARARIKWDGGQTQWLLEVENLPALPAGQEYHVWVIDPGQRMPVSCGVITPDGEGRVITEIRAARPIRQMRGFAISVEKAGGSGTPNGVLFLIGS